MLLALLQCHQRRKIALLALLQCHLRRKIALLVLLQCHLRHNIALLALLQHYQRRKIVLLALLQYVFAFYNELPRIAHEFFRELCFLSDETWRNAEKAISLGRKYGYTALLYRERAGGGDNHPAAWQRGGLHLLRGTD